MDPSPFVQVYGNIWRVDRYILALRFKKRVIPYRGRIHNPRVVFPPDSIVVLKGKIPQKLHVPSCFVYHVTQQKIFPHSIVVSDNRISTLLLALFPPKSVVKHHYQNNVLYVISKTNPFQHFWIKCRKDSAFHALCRLVTTISESKIPLRDVALLRFFKPDIRDKLHCFNTWYDFVNHLIFFKVFHTLNCIATPQVGKNVHEILLRSAVLPKHLPPPEMYNCEILLTDAQPLGIFCHIVDVQEVDYISPMVVSQILHRFNDVNHIECNFWMPLYRNYESWQSYGLIFYTTVLPNHMMILRNVLAWLRVQTIEKYKWLYEDMLHVGKIILGDEVE